jgi:hypothetical protein
VKSGRSVLSMGMYLVLIVKRSGMVVKKNEEV